MQHQRLGDSIAYRSVIKGSVIKGQAPKLPPPMGHFIAIAHLRRSKLKPLPVYPITVAAPKLFILTPTQQGIAPKQEKNHD